MGNRGSISIKNEKLPILFCHWDGDKESFQRLADDVLKVCGPKEKDSPYSRREPEAVMALLISKAVGQIGFSAYVGNAESDGDNSDNGHFVLDLNSGLVEPA